MEFVESFMKFSFHDDDMFRIEEDELITGTEGHKACECVVLISENVAFIEAKASAPNPANGRDFPDFIDDIKQKFANSLQLFTDMKMKVHGDDAFQRLPINLQTDTSPTDTYKIYLIIHGHREDWLIGLLDALKDAMREVVRQWNLRDSNIKVYNEEIALENKLIVAYVPKGDLISVKQDNGNADPAKIVQWFEEHIH
mgnify:CR=1 FL=1